MRRGGARQPCTEGTWERRNRKMPGKISVEIRRVSSSDTGGYDMHF